jgi:hypothetical protein
MLYKFKSKNTGDVIMLEPHGRQVLEIIGKEAGPKGIILPEQMPAALLALRAAIASEELLEPQQQLAQNAEQKSQSPHCTAPPRPAIHADARRMSPAG